MAHRFVSGQRWLSQTEPELGLGLVINTDADTVSIMFHSSETTRLYTVENPPLTRVRFSVGDVLKTQDGKSFAVEDVVEKDGVCLYVTKGKKIEESRLSDSLTFSKPIDRLLNAQVDDKSVYNLRHRALYRRFKTFRSPLRGLLGGRFHPAAHQLYVANQATRATHPRVLLCDEPGLGRRIEAGLILQRLELGGSAKRVLLVAPAAQLAWVELELERRFGYKFTRLTEESFGAAKPAAAKKSAAKKTASKKAAVKKSEEASGNPFEEASGWVSLPLEILKSKVGHAAAAAGFDVLVVDGAEALEWSEAAPSTAYKAVEEIAGTVASFIIMSNAGPETDLSGHEGRLRLLDPEDFGTLRKYHRHKNELQPLADLVVKLATATGWQEEFEAEITPFLPEEHPRAKEHMNRWKDGKDHERDHLIEFLLDGQECGRRVFHNTRHSINKLPTHEIEWVQLNAEPEVLEQLREEFKSKAGDEEDGKVKAVASAIDSAAAAWVGNIIAPPILPSVAPTSKSSDPPPAPPPPPKALVVCANRGRAMAVAKELSRIAPDKIVLINDQPREGVPADSAAVVVGLEDTCGRSFSEIDFVVIWDLPQSLLEARIASSLLDFATTKMIKMYLPYVEDTPQTVVTRWLHDGLEALHVYTPAQVGAAEEFSKAAHDLAKRMSARSNTKLDEELKSLSQKTAAAHEALQKKIEKNRDLLLEHASCRPHFADQALHRMTSNDDDPSLDSFMNRVLEHCGMLVDPKVGPRRASIKRNPEVNLHLDCIPKDGIEAAYNRRIASSRETSTFLNWDHDFVHQATHRLLSTSVGNTAYVVWEDDRAQIVLLEGIYIAEPAESDPALQIWRHMPATPVRVVVSHELEDLSSQYTTELVNKNVRNGRREWLRNNARPLHNLIPNMLRNLNQRAEYRAQELAAKAGHQMELILGADILRLQRLPASAHRKEEIKRIQNQQAELKKLIVVPTLRMDSLRLIRRGPSGKGI